MSTRSYHELMHISDFVERFEYLALRGGVGPHIRSRPMDEPEFLPVERVEASSSVRHRARDDNCDLGIPGYDIYGQSTIHTTSFR